MADNAPAQSLQVSAELEAEFEAALQYHLTDEDLERAKLLLGIETASRARELYSVATPDAIRNWALGVGDDNPLYTEEDYGPATRWGTQIGHGTMVGHVKTPMLGDPIPAEIKQQTKSLFRGVHVFVSGGTWDWYRPLRPGDRVYSYSGDESLEVKKSEFAGRSAVRVRRDVALNQFGEVLGVYRILAVLTERKDTFAPGGSRGNKNPRTTPTRTTNASTRSTSRSSRGTEKRYWDDVNVGDTLRRW